MHPETYPDFYLFTQIGSPYNILSRKPKDCDSDTEELTQVHFHYANDQAIFALLSSEALIEILKFPPINFCDDSSVISESESKSLEELYKAIAIKRAEIFIKTQSSCEYPGDLLTSGGEKSIFYETLEKLSYRESEYSCKISTPINESPELYSKYLERRCSYAPLKISYLTNILGILSDEDEHIILGELKEDYSGSINHVMGVYKELDEDSERRGRKISRVDFVTNLAAKRALTSDSIDEIITCTLIFGILRGYNTRSTIGAAWAQEMSMRYILAKKELPQFRKIPGVYLDIEASLLSENPAQEIKDLISKELINYKQACKLEACEKISDGLFDVPLPLRIDDFLLYLLVTQKYRDEDLREIILSLYQEKSAKETDGKYNEFTAITFAAKKSDCRFFEVLNDQIGDGVISKDNIILIARGVDWGVLNSVKDEKIKPLLQIFKTLLDNYYLADSESVLAGAGRGSGASPKFPVGLKIDSPAQKLGVKKG